MGDGYSELSALLASVRRRWRTVCALYASARVAAGAAAILAVAVAASWLAAPESAIIIALWGVAAIAIAGVALWHVPRLRQAPRDAQVARLIEERCPELEDALVTAVGQQGSGSHPMIAAVVRDAARRARDVDADRVISRRTIRRAAGYATAATVVFTAASAVSVPPAGRAARAAALYLFPYRIGLEVTPGDARLRAGESLRVVAQLSGGDSLVPLLRYGAAGEWRETRMEGSPDGFVATIPEVERDFQYRVTVAGTASRDYTVTLVYPPKVEQIDLRYEYPAAFDLAARTEEDGGDIYGPAGTRVRLTVHLDKPVRIAALKLADGDSIPLASRGDIVEGELTITEDGSYRVSLADADGLTSAGDTEYFIRTLQDSPPDVRIIRPASDRQATPVEEVAIEARADDDFGVAALDLVYSVGGRPERSVSFERNGSGTSVTGQRMLYLEDLGVKPGDVVAYYARARDVSRGKRPSEARSDIFFLEVTPFEEEFVASQSQGMGGGGDEEAIETLIQAEKDVITATWNLDRRERESGGRSPDDIRAVGGAQRNVRTRAATIIAEMQRAAELRRRRQPVGRGGQAAAVADAMLDAMSKSAAAMQAAEGQLIALKTAEALPHEMTSLNELLRAQAEVRRREIQQQGNGTGGPGGNRRQQDLSSLFDRELARQQQTNYETPPGAERNDEQRGADDAARRIQELARRQDELNRREEELARRRNAMPQEELRRELERLTREQSELRRQTEELARELQQPSSPQSEGQGSQGRGSRGQGSEGQGSQGHGSPGQGAPGGARRGGAAAGQAQAGDRQSASRELQQASEEMQGAASELRRDNPQEASARGSRAADRLRGGEQRLRGGGPDDSGRAVGELQLESRQLADAQRRLGTGAGARGADQSDTARRRASEQDRLAERAERLEEAVRQLAGQVGGGDARDRALDQASQEVDRQRLSQRMRDAARAERQGGQGQGQVGQASDERANQATPGSGSGAQRPQGGAGRSEDIARGLERLADRLGAAGGQDAASQQLSGELSEIRRLREELSTLDRQLAEMRRNGDSGSPQDGRGGQNGRGTQSGSGTRDGRGTQPGGMGQQGNVEAPWEEVRGLMNELRAADVAPPDADGFNPGRSAPGTEGWKQDFTTWDELKVQLQVALENAERTTADRLREQQSRDRLNAGATQSVPEQYRRLVEKYYRALAGGK